MSLDYRLNSLHERPLTLHCPRSKDRSIFSDDPSLLEKPVAKRQHMDMNFKMTTLTVGNVYSSKELSFTYPILEIFAF